MAPYYGRARNCLPSSHDGRPGQPSEKQRSTLHRCVFAGQPTAHGPGRWWEKLHGLAWICRISKAHRPGWAGFEIYENLGGQPRPARVQKTETLTDRAGPGLLIWESHRPGWIEAHDLRTTQAGPKLARHEFLAGQVDMTQETHEFCFCRPAARLAKSLSTVRGLMLSVRTIPVPIFHIPTECRARIYEYEISEHIS